MSRFCWADLSTTDGAAARRFYADLLGWEFADVIALCGGRPAAAVIEQSMHAAHWNVYVAVESADAAAERASGLGATVVEPPFDVGPAGRLSLMKDPAGAAFCVWQAGEHEGFGAVGEPGFFTQATLVGTDPATGFYEALFPGLRYETEAGERARWRATFAVPDADAARRRVTELGGTILSDSGRGFVAADPAGAEVGFK